MRKSLFKIMVIPAFAVLAIGCNGGGGSSGASSGAPGAGPNPGTGAESPPSKITYVSLDGDDSTGLGTQAAPYKSLEKAIQEAGEEEEIRVAIGDYDLAQTLVLKNGMRLRGGYLADWRRTSQQPRLLITADIGLQCTKLSSLVVVDGFTFIPKPGGGFPGAFDSGMKFDECSKIKLIGSKVMQGYTGSASSAGVDIKVDPNVKSFIRIERNEIVTPGTGAAEVTGIKISGLGAGSEVDIVSNIFKGNLYSSEAHQAISLSELGNANSAAKTLRIRNNTIQFGAGSDSSKYSTFLGESSTTDNNGVVDVHFENNIVFAGATTNQFKRNVFDLRAQTIWNMVSVKNNNFHKFDAILVVRGGQSFSDIAELEAYAGAAASGNLSLDPYDPNAVCFEEGLGSLTLNPTCPTSISKGGLNGTNLLWNFVADFQGVLFGKDGTWSMGAYQQ